jgi:regulatory protein
MKITKITQQQKDHGRYSIFVDEKYAFSLSETALLDSKLASGQEVSKEQVDAFKQLSTDDKLYNRALNYVAMRPRTVWEIRAYLERKHSPALLIEQITNKLSHLGMLDDAKFAQMFVRDRALLRPTSRRKIIAELRKKRVPEEAIELALQEEQIDESAVLRDLVAKKRQQTKYRNDDLKLMQYFARQGFSYGDIKAALGAEAED